MKLLIPFLLLTLSAQAADYVIAGGDLHKSGSATIAVRPDAKEFKVLMSYELVPKEFAPVPRKFLKSKKTFTLPPQFRTLKGYQELERAKTLSVHKATLKFLKRANMGKLKDAYFVQILPTNKKSKIDLVYHPSLKDAGWSELTITLLSKIPLVDGYQLKAKLK